MVNTRSQARSSIPVFMSKASRNDRVSDTESECSIPDLLTRDQIDELDNENLIHSEQHPDKMTIDQRFSSMNRQINELTGLVLALTEKLSSNHGEGNDQNAVTDKTSERSDNPIPGKSLYKVTKNPTRKPKDDYDEEVQRHHQSMNRFIIKFDQHEQASILFVTPSFQYNSRTEIRRGVWENLSRRFRRFHFAQIMHYKP